jgi:hypothetical protein
MLEGGGQLKPGAYIERQELPATVPGRYLGRNPHPSKCEGMRHPAFA